MYGNGHNRTIAPFKQQQEIAMKLSCCISWNRNEDVQGVPYAIISNVIMEIRNMCCILKQGAINGDELTTHFAYSAHAVNQT